MKNQFKAEVTMIYAILVGLPVVLLLLAAVLHDVGVLRPKMKVTTNRPN